MFETMYDDYIGGQPSAAPRTILAAQAPQVLQTPTTTTTTADTAPTPTNSLSQATNIPSSSQNVDELETQQQHGEPSRPVLTRNQLKFDGDMCMYALTVSTIELKNVNEAMTDPAWIESMQEELLQFKRLDVWVLVPLPDHHNEKQLRRLKGMSLVDLRGNRKLRVFGIRKDSVLELNRIQMLTMAGCRTPSSVLQGGAHFLGEKVVSGPKENRLVQRCLPREARILCLYPYACAQVLWMRTQFTGTMALLQQYSNLLITWKGGYGDSVMLSDGELFGNSENSQCVINDFSNTLIDFSMVLWLQWIYQRPTNCCLIWGYKAVKVRNFCSSDPAERRELPRNFPLDRVEVLGGSPLQLDYQITRCTIESRASRSIKNLTRTQNSNIQLSVLIIQLCGRYGKSFLEPTSNPALGRFFLTCLQLLVHDEGQRFQEPLAQSTKNNTDGALNYQKSSAQSLG
ncbi:hypothetical protein Tco_0898038 [Tanacetum coccineum]